MTKLSFFRMPLSKRLGSAPMFVHCVLPIWIVVVLHTLRNHFLIFTTITKVAILLSSAFATRSWIVHMLDSIFKEVFTDMHLMRLVITAHFRLIGCSKLWFLHFFTWKLIIFDDNEISLGLAFNFSGRYNWWFRYYWYKFTLVLFISINVNDIIFVFFFICLILSECRFFKIFCWINYRLLPNFWSICILRLLHLILIYHQHHITYFLTRILLHGLPIRPELSTKRYI